MAYDHKTQSRPVISKTHHELLRQKAKRFKRTQQKALETAIEQYQEDLTLDYQKYRSQNPQIEADYKRKGK